ncbi:MAG: sulfite exporter TauE/SafE family protein [Bacteroidota bacterium]
MIQNSILFSMMQATGYFLSVIIGFSLGLIGGGGSILTIPVLVFFFEIDPVIASTYSLFIVGLAAISGSITHYRMHNIDYGTVLLFGIPSVMVLFIMRRYLVNLIPPVLFHSGGVVITRSVFILGIFSLLMLAAGWSMIRQAGYVPSKEKQNPARLVVQGCITGAVTGFIGIGGGFIIVPSLVLFAGLPMKKAIGTSLTIIILNCFVGILSNIVAVESLNFVFLATFAAFTIAGILAGTWATRFIPDKKLKPVFGWIILAMSVVVLVRTFVHT